MSAILALNNLDRYLSGLSLSRDEHAVIQLYVSKVRQEMEVTVDSKT